LSEIHIKRFEIWLANLNPQRGTESGKTRPVLIVQTDLLNNTHPSTIVCPLTTNVQANSDVLRVHLKKGESGLKEDSDLLMDQQRAIDNKRLIDKLGDLPVGLRKKILHNLKIVLDLDW
jgi:mRNA interferase MazF